MTKPNRKRARIADSDTALVRGNIRLPGHRLRVATTNTEPSLTKQSFRDETNVNNIVERFSQTGQLPTMNPGQPQYIDVPVLDSFEAACITANAASAIADGALDQPIAEPTPDTEVPVDGTTVDTPPAEEPENDSESQTEAPKNN